MALTLDEVRRIAQLARLRFGSEEETTFVEQLGEVVGYIDQLADFASAEEDPALSGGGEEAEDRRLPGLQRDAFLANAPESSDGFLVVPKVKGDVDE